MRLVTRVFSTLARVSGRVSTLHYFAAATLRLADVKEGIRSAWQGFHSREADIAAGLMPWEEDLVGRFVKSGDAVLVIGSGSGRDLIPLGGRGCRVTGVEPASAAFEIARRVVRERQLSATLIEGFFEDVPLSGHFAVVMFSYYSYSYIPESRRRIGVLRKAVTHLTAGGHILLNYPITNRPHPVIIRLARAVGTLCGSDWRLEPGDLVSRPGAGAFYDYAHAFSPEEIATEMAAAGLHVLYRHDFPEDRVVALAATHTQVRNVG
jgi:SAM-dependent methyltransferase